ncbi:MAG: hypothetical protein ABJA81_06825 [Nocardioidaceae bacterium]
MTVIRSPTWVVPVAFVGAGVKVRIAVTVLPPVDPPTSSLTYFLYEPAVVLLPQLVRSPTAERRAASHGACCGLARPEVEAVLKDAEQKRDEEQGDQRELDGGGTRLVS